MEVLDRLKSKGWTVTEAEGSYSCSNSKYQQAPEEYRTFIEKYTAIHKGDGTAWFIAPEEFDTNSKEGISWNEFEKISLDAEEDDAEMLKLVTDFWNNTLPIIISVGTNYRYIGIVLFGENKGKVITGEEPMFEEFDILADSFDVFMKDFVKLTQRFF